MKVLLFLVALCVGLQGSRGGCPVAFQQYDESCYKVFVETATWIDAKKYCQIFGGDLVKIETQEEETTLEQVLNDVHANRTAKIENYWVDGSDVLTEGEWRWVGTPGYSQLIAGGYSNWEDGQPDNYGGSENCIQIRYDFNMHWNDEDCDEKDSFICEAESTSQVIDLGQKVHVRSIATVPTIQAATDVLSCPEGFERHGYRCYKVFTDHVKWVDAKQYCQIYGADLLEIDSAQEEFIVEGMIKRLHGTVHGEEVFWTDGTDLLMEGEWRWAGQGGESRLIQGYTHWADGQPSNDNGNENCLAIRAQFKYEWNDDKCSRLKAFICEAPYETGQISVIG